MKCSFLPKTIRHLPAILMAACFATIASVARASMICTWIEDFPLVSNPTIEGWLEAHVKALPGIKNYQIRDIDGRFFMVLADDGFCKEIPRCYHQLLDTRNGVVRDVFSFRGTGKAWRLMSPTSIWLEQLQDEYSIRAFATTDDTFIGVQLPRFRDTILIDAPSPEQMKTLRAACDPLTR
jgi:hypothetical protein